MRILVISVFPPLEVPEADHSYRMCENLAKAGVEVHVLAQRGAVTPNISNFVVHGLMQRWDWAELWPLVKLLRRLTPDAVLLNYVGHAFNYQAMVTFTATITRWLLPRTRFVTQISYPQGAKITDQHKSRYHKVFRWLCRVDVGAEFGTLLRDSRHIIVLTTKHIPALERYDSGVSRKTAVIPPAALMPMAPADDRSRQEIRTGMGIATGDFLFVYFGYVYAGKGIETLFRAFHALRQRKEKVKLALIGGGVGQATGSENRYAGELRRLLVELNLEKDVQFTGSFPWDSELGSKYLRAADAAALPFDQGVSLNNSSFASVMAHGLPTVTTYGDILEDAIEDGNNVLLCCPQEAAQLATALQRMMEDDNLRDRLRTGALALAENCFSWRTATERLITCLTD